MLKYIIGIIGLFLYTVASIATNNILEVHYLDIGQGDSVLISTPDDYDILVDGGPGNDVLSELGEVLSFWDREIDLVIATHPDADHIFGLIEVLKRYDVEKVMMTTYEHNSLLFKHFLELVKEKEIEIIYADSTNDLDVGCCLKLDLLWPMHGNIDGLDSNDTSIAFLASFGDFDMYFDGDLSSKYEEIAAKEIMRDLEVVKLGHHGSKTSSSDIFFDIIDPDIAIISCGFQNKFGHPHEEVLEKLKNRKIKYYRTDQDGRITLESDGKSYKVLK